MADVMLDFAEYSGFFGIGRGRYATIQIDFDSLATLESEWSAALNSIARWRDRHGTRAEKALWLLLGPPPLASAAMTFVVTKAIRTSETLTPELRGLGLSIAVMGKDEGEVFMDLTLNPFLTGKEKPLPSPSMLD